MKNLKRPKRDNCQINGKLRGKVTIKTGTSESEIKSFIEGDDNIYKYIKNRDIKKLSMSKIKL